MKNNNPLISVLITCYNYGQFIEECLKSIYEQDYKNFEVLVINDGSTDNSDSIIKKLKKKYQFEYLSQSNKGIAITRNIGIEWANGDFYVQIDADDTIPSNFFSTLVNASKNNNADIFYTKAKNLTTGATIVDPPVFNTELIKYKNYIHTSAFVKTTLHKKYLYDEYLNKRGLEDWDLYQSMILGGAVAYRVDGTHLNYRIHPESASRGDQSRGSIEGVRAVQYILSKHYEEYPEEMANLEWLIDVIKRATQLYDELDRIKNDATNQIEHLTQRLAQLDDNLLEITQELSIEKSQFRRLKKIKRFIAKFIKR